MVSFCDCHCCAAVSSSRCAAISSSRCGHAAVLSSHRLLNASNSCCLIASAGCCILASRCATVSFSRCTATLLSYRCLLTAPPSRRLITRRATRSPCHWCFSITPKSWPLPVALLSTHLDNTTSAMAEIKNTTIKCKTHPTHHLQGKVNSQATKNVSVTTTSSTSHDASCFARSSNSAATKASLETKGVLCIGASRNSVTTFSDQKTLCQSTKSDDH